MTKLPKEGFSYTTYGIQINPEHTLRVVTLAHLPLF